MHLTAQSARAYSDTLFPTLWNLWFALKTFRFVSVRRSASSVSAGSVSFPVPAGSGSVERAIARERTRDSASALEAEGRLIGVSRGAIAPPVIAERAIARDLG